MAKNERILTSIYKRDIIDDFGTIYSNELFERNENYTLRGHRRGGQFLIADILGAGLIVKSLN